MLTSNLACGPMSTEIIEAVFRYSHKTGKHLMLICSRNQIDRRNGYVFHTYQYREYIEKMKLRYALANVAICRDHCGPGFGAETEHDLEGTKETIRCDLENGFDLIHIDLCLAFGMSHEEKLKHTLELMKYALSIRSDVLFEIGTDENVGIAETDVNRIMSDVKICQRIVNPTFYVVQTGSLVYGAHNIGSFGPDVVEKMHRALHLCGIKLKEHNADYLTAQQLGYRRGIVDAVNIAPQLGVVQTSHVLSRAMVYGIDTNPFVYDVVHGKKWQKWSDDWKNHLLCATLAGHYHFGEMEYQLLIDQLESRCDIHESIICVIMDVIEHYSSSLGMTS